MEVTNWFRTRYDELETAKANASQQEASALANLQADIYNATLSQINQINMMNMQNEMNLANWEKQRVATLQDYEQQLKIEAQYQTNPINYNTPSITSGISSTTPTTPTQTEVPQIQLPSSQIQQLQQMTNMGFVPNSAYGFSYDPTRYQ